MTLPEQGFRFVLRVENGLPQSRWVHPTEVRPGDVDCTSMDDDAFVRACNSFWDEHIQATAGEQP